MTFEDMHIVSIDTNEHDLFLVKRNAMDLRIRVSNFSDSVQAMMFVIEHDIDLIVINYDMPELDGLEFILEFRKNHTDIPIIMLYGEDEEEEKDKKKKKKKPFIKPTKKIEKDVLFQKAFEAGVSDIIEKPLDGVLFKLSLQNLLLLRHNNMLLNDQKKLLKEEVDKVTEQFNKHEFETLDVLSKTAEYKDHNTNTHISRISHYSKILAAACGLSERAQNIIYHASAFHDIGKVGIPDKYLLIPRKLKEEEFEVMKRHTLIGYDILKNAKDQFLITGRNIALTHHERYNGTGYPKGLKGHKIPIEGRIVAIADVFDALTSERPHKEAWDFDKAVEYIEEQSGKQFDPELVQLFKKNIKKFKEIYETYK